ncbi:MAG TPA: TolC family protein [Saprospiraceae bacterium]|nr:TolC family protein [Saprospiraceae bacterium]HMP25663.1 TolC family protein [Saprospiraceae bacterium]
MLRHLFTILFTLYHIGSMGAQEGRTVSFSLSQIVDIAQNQSIAARQAATVQTTRYWEWRSFQADLKPQLLLAGTLPDFNRTFRAITQPSGTIAFQPISNNNAELSLALQQNIPATGGTLFIQSNVQRFDDFNPRKTLYNGAPMLIGFVQPLFQFNPWKWDKQIEPLKYQESQQQYLFEKARIATQAVDLYFNLLSAQINLQIAAINQSNTDTLYAIAQERLRLGKASKNDVLQLRLETLNARKAFATARQDVQSRTLQLRTFIGYREADLFTLLLPDGIPAFLVQEAQALQEALYNRPDVISFQRQLLEAQRDVARARGETGLQINLNGSFGFAKSGGQFSDVYQNPQDLESVRLGLSIPVLDWGRARARRETAAANQQLMQYQVEQARLDFENEIRTQVTLLEMFRYQVDLTAEADKIAAERYEIAQNRYILGNLSITDLSIALQEKDRAKRDYVLALWDFWAAYYNLRMLTLYDFEKGKRIAE